MQGYYRKRGCKCKGSKCTCGATWSFSIDLGRDPSTGKRKQKTSSGFSTKKDAQIAVAKLIQELSQGTYISEKTILFKDFVEEWIKIYEKNVKVSSVRIRTHESKKLIQLFSGMQVRHITRGTYQRSLVNLLEQGFSYNTISGVHSTGRMIFKKAVELEIIKTDPTQYAKVPKSIKSIEDIENENSIPKYLEKKDLLKLLDTAREYGLDRDYEIFLTLAYTGMRVGEICALKWSDVDYDKGTFSITKTYYNPSNRVTEYQLLTPKTASSKRLIEVDQIVLDALAKIQQTQMILKDSYLESFHDGNFVFGKIKTHLGYPELIKIVEERMKRLLKIAALDSRLTPHSLRHTHTSLLAEAGVGIHEIMDRLGHQDDKITRQVYLHVTQTMKKEASDKFSLLMNIK